MNASPKAGKSARAQHRIDIDNDSAMPITIRRLDDNDTEFSGTLLDVSTSGMKLLVDRPLVFMERIYVVAPLEDGEILEAEAEVRWIKNADEKSGSCSVGCAFVNPLSHEAITAFAVSGGVDRRSAPRESTERTATAQWEASETSFPVTLVNASPSGFCLFSETGGQVGRKVRYKLKQEDDQPELSVQGTAKWIREFESGFLIGCEAEASPAGKNSMLSRARNTVARRGLSTGVLFCVVVIVALFYFSQWII